MTTHIDKPFLAVDACIFMHDSDDTNVLLMQRKYEPFKDHWALPGGHVDKDEPLIDAAYRELEEETNISLKDFVSQLQQVQTFGDPGRDPRGWYISVLHVGEVREGTIPHAADDAKDARWFSLDELPPLAFDHEKMIDLAIEFQHMKSICKHYHESVDAAVAAL